MATGSARTAIPFVLSLLTINSASTKLIAGISQLLRLNCCRDRIWSIDHLPLQALGLSKLGGMVA
jgi:hypothetical protein